MRPPRQPYQPLQTHIAEYRDRRAFQRDATQRASVGWRIVSTIDGKTTKTLLGLIVSGELFLSRRRLIVTYQRP
jgi:hypothetical protein